MIDALPPADRLRRAAIEAAGLSCIIGVITLMFAGPAILAFLTTDLTKAPPNWLQEEGGVRNGMYSGGVPDFFGNGGDEDDPIVDVPDEDPTHKAAAGGAEPAPLTLATVTPIGVPTKKPAPKPPEKKPPATPKPTGSGGGEGAGTGSGSAEAASEGGTLARGSADAAKSTKPPKCGGANPQVVKINDTTYDVDRDLVEYYGASPARINTLGYGLGYNENGEKGWLIGGFGCSNPVYKAGLRSKDVLQFVNDKPVNNVFQLVGLWLQLKAKKSFEIQVLRKGKKMTFIYNVKDLPGGRPDGK